MQFRVVEVGMVKSTGEAIAAGFRQASAPVVAYAEEHSYPDTGWAEAHINAHQQLWAAVGGTIINANPDTIISWSHVFNDFGPYIGPVEGGEVSSLPGHHISYKREILSQYGPALGTLLESEHVLLQDLLAKGYKLYQEPAAKSHHVHFSRFFPYLRAEFQGGHLYGEIRFHWCFCDALWGKSGEPGGSVI